jgi:membrane protease YdiL (CAAX protease family)
MVEELFFRGYLQTRLVARWGRWTGIALTALAFGLVHMDWVHSTFAFLLGLWLGWMTERAGSIRPAMLVHGANNLLAMVWERWLPSSEGLSSRGLSISVSLSLLALLLCVLALHRSLGRAAPEEQVSALAG